MQDGRWQISTQSHTILPRNSKTYGTHSGPGSPSRPPEPQNLYRLCSSPLVSTDQFTRLRGTFSVSLPLLTLTYKDGQYYQTTCLQLLPRLRMDQAIAVLSLYPSRVCTETNIPLPLPLTWPRCLRGIISECFNASTIRGSNHVGIKQATVFVHQFTIFIYRHSSMNKRRQLLVI